MGSLLFGSISSSSFDSTKESVLTKNNPDPYNYTIKMQVQIGKYLIVYIIYPDCTNYEGKKILVYKDIKFEDLQKQMKIDPHFSDNKRYYSPIARFKPDKEGIDMTIRFCKLFSKLENILGI